MDMRAVLIVTTPTMMARGPCPTLVARHARGDAHPIFFACSGFLCPGCSQGGSGRVTTRPRHFGYCGGGGTSWY